MSETDAATEAIPQRQRPARIQREFVSLRQEIEKKNSSIQREIKAVASQIDRLRTNDSNGLLDVTSSSSLSLLDFSTSSLKHLQDSPRFAEMAPKDPTTELVAELQTKLEAQQCDLDDARTALATARQELEDFKARSLSDSCDAKKLETVSQRVLELTAVVEDQQTELNRANELLSARSIELARLEAELSSCNEQKALEDSSEELGPRRMRGIIREQTAELTSLKEQVVKLQDQAAEVLGLKEKLRAQDVKLKKAQELSSCQQSALENAVSKAQEERAQVVQAHEVEITALRAELRQLGQIEELQTSIEDLRVELATTKAQLVTRNLEMTKLEAQLVGRNVELNKYEEQRNELASVKAQLIDRDMKLVKQEVTQALSDSPTSSEAASPRREGALRSRIALLESEATANVDKIRKLEDDLRRRDDLLVKTPIRQLEAIANDASETLADELAQLAAEVFTKNDALAEKQLVRARAFLKVLQDAAWAKEATPGSFGLRKLLDDVASSLEPRIKAYSATGKIEDPPKRGTRGAISSSASLGRGGVPPALTYSAGSSSSPPATAPALAADSSDKGMSSRTSPTALPQEVQQPLSYRRLALDARLPNTSDASSFGRADLLASSTGVAASSTLQSSTNGAVSSSRLRHPPLRVAGVGVPVSATVLSGGRPPPNSGAKADQDRTTEAILSSLQNNSSGLNYSTGSLGSRVVGSASATVRA